MGDLIKIFETERLIFSIWNENSLDDAKKLWGNREVSKLITAKGIFSEEEIEGRVQLEMDNLGKFRVQYFPIYLKETGEIVGCCGLRPYDVENEIYEIGVHLLPDYWRQRLAWEACRKIIRYAFEERGFEALFAGHHPKNSSSMKLLSSLGFKLIGEQFYPPTGLKHPSYILRKRKY